MNSGMETYWHLDIHPAMRVFGTWKFGEVMTAARVAWPVVGHGQPIRCGTCGQEFTLANLRHPYLRLAVT